MRRQYRWLVSNRTALAVDAETGLATGEQVGFSKVIVRNVDLEAPQKEADVYVRMPAAIKIVVRCGDRARAAGRGRKAVDTCTLSPCGPNADWFLVRCAAPCRCRGTSERALRSPQVHGKAYVLELELLDAEGHKLHIAPNMRFQVRGGALPPSARGRLLTFGVRGAALVQRLRSGHGGAALAHAGAGRCRRGAARQHHCDGAHSARRVRPCRTVPHRRPWTASPTTAPTGASCCRRPCAWWAAWR